MDVRCLAKFSFSPLHVLDYMSCLHVLVASIFTSEEEDFGDESVSLGCEVCGLWTVELFWVMSGCGGG